jgi:hypothetical protein
MCKSMYTFFLLRFHAQSFRVEELENLPQRLNVSMNSTRLVDIIFP